MRTLACMGRTYARLLNWSLRHRLAVVGIALAVFIASFAVASTLKFSFFPQQDSGEFTIGYDLPPGTTLAETDRLAKQAEAVLQSDSAIQIRADHRRWHRKLRAGRFHHQAA